MASGPERDVEPELEVRLLGPLEVLRDGVPVHLGAPKAQALFGYQGWGKANRHYWLADYPGWVEFFMSQVFTEPYSTKQR